MCDHVGVGDVGVDEIDGVSKAVAISTREVIENANGVPIAEQ
jgi:hypothetical protein